MRTKTLLVAAALAAGVATSMAQSNVYSLNVVGYVNVVLPGDATPVALVANPLNNTNNNITNLFSQNIPDGSIIQRWNPTLNGGDFDPTAYVYSGGLHKWFDTAANQANGFILNLGEAIFFINGASSITNTFVGEVFQGSYTNTLVAQNLANAIGSSEPIGGNFTNAIAGLVPADGDIIEFWDPANNGGDFALNSLSYSLGLHAWQATSGSPNDPVNSVAPGQGFFLFDGSGNAGTRQWVRNFTVQ